MDGYRLSILGIKAPNNWPIPMYSIQHDSALLVALGRFGYGNWQKIRQDLADTNSTGWANLQGPQITRRGDYLLKELYNRSKSSSSRKSSSSSKSSSSRKSSITSTSTSASDETRIIEKFRRPFKPLRSSLIALESLKNDGESCDSSLVGSVLSDHLKKLGDFISTHSNLKSDPEAWNFIACFWPYENGSTGSDLKLLYEAL